MLDKDDYRKALEKEAGPKPRRAPHADRCIICDADPPLTLDPFHPGAIMRIRWTADHRGWLVMFRRPDKEGFVWKEVSYVCPECTPKIFAAAKEERAKLPKRGCAVCGAPHGEKCTASCDDDMVPEEKVEKWRPESYPLDLDLLAPDA